MTVRLVGWSGGVRGVAARTAPPSEPEARVLGTEPADRASPGSLPEYGALEPTQYRRAKRLFEATMPGLWPDSERIYHTKGVMRMIANRRHG